MAEEQAVKSGSRANLIHHVVSHYIAAQREFNRAAEHCVLKGWPDKKAALRETFRVQELFCDREAMRLDYWTNSDRDEAEWRSYTSVAAVRTRLGQDWTAAEEQALAQNDAHYAEILG